MPVAETARSLENVGVVAIAEVSMKGDQRAQDDGADPCDKAVRESEQKTDALPMAGPGSDGKRVEVP